LRTPNSDDCFIEVDGKRRSWRDGEAMVFDETFIHYDKNKTDVTRLILFCDVERPLRGRIPTAINRFIINHVLKATSTQNQPGEPIGIANGLFAGVYQIRLLGKRIKKWNRKVYYVGKYALVAGITAWLLI
jgi:beta-hydroxylase